MQSRDLVEAHRLVFSAKLYDHQGPIARGGRTTPPPLTVRVMRNALTGRGLIMFHVVIATHGCSKCIPALTWTGLEAVLKLMVRDLFKSLPMEYFIGKMARTNVRYRFL